MQDGAALLDLTPFTKIDVSGPDALALLNHLAAAQMDVAVGRAVYTPLLNERGGIEADVTMTRLAADRFRIVSGAATRRRDLALLRRAARGHAVRPSRTVTEDFCVIGVMGAAARARCSPHSRADDWTGFPFSTARERHRRRRRLPRDAASPMSASCGWELTIANAERRHGLRCADRRRVPGRWATTRSMAAASRRATATGAMISGPRSRRWRRASASPSTGRRISAARSALEHQRQQGITQRLVLLSIAGHPLIVHDEPVLENGAGGRPDHLGRAGRAHRPDAGAGAGERRAGRNTGADRGAQLRRSRSPGRCLCGTVLHKPPYDPARRKDDGMTDVNVVIIGGGAMGCSLLYHLAKAGWTRHRAGREERPHPRLHLACGGPVHAFRPQRRRSRNCAPPRCGSTATSCRRRPAKAAASTAPAPCA